MTGAFRVQARRRARPSRALENLRALNPSGLEAHLMLGMLCVTAPGALNDAAHQVLIDRALRARREAGS